MKTVILTLLVLLIFSCTNSPSLSAVTTHDSIASLKSNATVPRPHKSKKLGDFMSDTSYISWSAKMNDKGSYWVRLSFQQEFADYQFHGQCIYSFFTNYYYTGTDVIELLWSYKTDCVLDMDFLRKSNGAKEYPKPGDSFCEYRLINDSVIAVKYNFPEWTNRVNRIAKDSLFPSFFYLDRRL